MKSLATPMLYLFDSYPREASVPQRLGILRDRAAVGRFVNEHNGRTHVYVSAFAYDRMRDTRKPDYASARIGFVPMDFDGLDDGIPEAFRMHNWLLDRGIEHACCFSGGGCHLFVRATTPAKVRLASAVLNGAQMWLERSSLGSGKSLHPTLGQESFFGDPARCIRVPNTWNPKRHRFDVPLTAGIFENLASASDYKEAANLVGRRQVSLDPREFVQEGESLDVSRWDEEKFLPPRAQWRPADLGEFASSDEDSGVPVEIRSPLIAQLIQPSMNNEDRGRVIFYLYENGYSLGEVVRFLREHLSPTKFHHAMFYERQPQRIWDNYVK